MYTELKGRMEQSPALGEQGSRVQSIDLEAQALFEETMAMMLRMESKTLYELCIPISCTGEGLLTDECLEQSCWSGEQGEGRMFVFLTPPELCRREEEAQPSLT